MPDPKAPTSPDARLTPVAPPARPRSVAARRALARAIAVLPQRVRATLAGPPVIRRGAQLDPEVGRLLNLAKHLASKPVHQLPLADARRALDEDARILEPAVSQHGSPRPTFHSMS